MTHFPGRWWKYSSIHLFLNWIRFFHYKANCIILSIDTLSCKFPCLSRSIFINDKSVTLCRNLLSIFINNRRYMVSLRSIFQIKNSDLLCRSTGYKLRTSFWIHGVPSSLTSHTRQSVREMNTKNSLPKISMALAEYPWASDNPKLSFRSATFD